MGDPLYVSEARSKLGRLHSLLFGTDVALANDDYETSLGLGLRLAGFLASELKTSEDEVYFRNILLHAQDNIGLARQATESDRYVLEQAKCPAGFKFSSGRPIDLDRVRRSKYLGDIFSSTGTLPKEPESNSARGSIEQPEPSSARVGTTEQLDPCSATIGATEPPEQSSARIGATLQPEPCSESIGVQLDPGSAIIGTSMQPEPSSESIGVQVDPSSATIGATLQLQPSSESIGVQLDPSSATIGARLQPEPSSESIGVQLDPRSATIAAMVQPEPSSESIGVQLDPRSATIGATVQPEPSSERGVQLVPISATIEATVRQEPRSARIGATVQFEPTTLFREGTAALNPDFNSVERSEPVIGRNLCQSKLTSLYTGLRTKTGEKIRHGESSLHYLNSRASRSRLSPDVKVCRSPNRDDLLNGKRGPFSDFNRWAQKKPRPESEDGGEYNNWRRFQSNGKVSTRAVDDEIAVRRDQHHYFNGSQRKTGPVHDDPNADEYPIEGSQYSLFSRARAKTKPVQDDASEDVKGLSASFITARHQMAINEANPGNPPRSPIPSNFGRRTLGMRPRGPRGAFIPPFRDAKVNAGPSRVECNSDSATDESTRRCLEMLAGPDGELPERLRNIEPKLLEHITNEIMEGDPMARWDDIAGLEHAKKCVTEMVIWPLLRPDIFKGCRAPAKGLLLFGPPGTGKTMIGKAIAGEARATFFSISASSIMSKWLGEAEKLVRALFGIAACRQPAVIFIDEVDSLLSQRKSEGENDSSRKIKTQFLVEMEGCGTGTEQVLVIGATNRPQELDEAARRRLSKRLYIPLPSSAARSWIVRNLLGKDELLSLSDEEIEEICTYTDGYSGSDMKNLVKEASMGPLREALMNGKQIDDITNDDMRPISLQDFVSALQQVRSSVSQNELGLYEDWNKQFGSLAV